MYYDSLDSKLNLTFMCPCVAGVITNDDQQDATILICLCQSALHVSCDSIAHHQEHITVFTASGIVHRYQQYRWTITDAVNTVMCSWWWTTESPETCRADWNKQIKNSWVLLVVICNYTKSNFTWNQNYIQDKAKSRLFSRISCYHLFQNLFSSCLLYVAQYKVISVPVVLYSRDILRVPYGLAISRN
jgi:hypothetical protein